MIYYGKICLKIIEQKKAIILRAFVRYFEVYTQNFYRRQTKHT